MDIVRLIFEKGLEVSQSPHSLKLLGPHSTVGAIISEVRDRYQLRPIIITHRIEWKIPNNTQHENSDSLLSLAGLDSLDVKLTGLLDLTGIQDDRTTMLQHMFNLHYIVGAVVYHCRQLAITYSDICRGMHRISSIPKYGEGDSSGYQHQAEPYYEFDALVTAARRAYDTSRYLLWNRFGSGEKSVPTSFIKTVPKCSGLPVILKDFLMDSWDRFGVKLTAYRDCIQHYVPLDLGISTAMMSRLDSGIWVAVIRIPDNPEARSKSKFRYDGGLDALKFGWELTNEVVTLATKVVKATTTAAKT